MLVSCFHLELKKKRKRKDFTTYIHTLQKGLQHQTKLNNYSKIKIKLNTQRTDGRIHAKKYNRSLLSLSNKKKRKKIEDRIPHLHTPVEEADDCDYE
jgi:hypothetical protein